MLWRQHDVLSLIEAAGASLLRPKGLHLVLDVDLEAVWTLLEGHGPCHFPERHHSMEYPEQDYPLPTLLELLPERFLVDDRVVLAVGEKAIVAGPSQHRLGVHFPQDPVVVS